MPGPRRLLTPIVVGLACLGAPAAAHADRPTSRVTFPGDAGPRSAAIAVRATMTVRIEQAAHASGIASAWLTVDGARAAEVRLPCADDLASACDDVLSPLDLSFDTTRFAGGRHIIGVGLVDGDGTSTQVTSRSVVIDNEAPAAPRPLSAIAVRTKKDAVQISWGRPSNEWGALAPQITVCDAGGCRPGVASAATWFVATGLPLGDTTVRVVLRDQAGNVDPANVTTWTITRVPTVRAAAGLTIRSARVARGGRTVAVRGTIRNALAGQRVTVLVKAGSGRRVRTVRVMAPVRAGSFRANAKLPSARWRLLSVAASTPGNSWYLPGRSVRRARS